AERAAQIRWRERVRRDDAEGLSDDRADRRVRFVGDGVLVDRAVRVAGDRRAAAVDVNIGFVGRNVAERLAEWREEAVGPEKRHSRTSIGTSRKRACAAP